MDPDLVMQGLYLVVGKTAENICIKKGYSSIAVISGVGVKNYYRKLGYEEEDTYMIKRINWYQVLLFHITSL